MMRTRKMNNSEFPEAIIEFRAGRDDAIMFVIHSITGTSNCYRELISLLKGDCRIIGINAPGRMRKSVEFRTFDDLVRHAVANILWGLGQNLGAKIYICGYSYGGAVGYAATKILTDEHRIFPELICIIDPISIVAQKDRGADREFWIMFANLIGRPSLERMRPKNKFWEINEAGRLEELFSLPQNSKSGFIPPSWSYAEYIAYFEYVHALWKTPVKCTQRDGEEICSIYYHTAKSKRDGQVNTWLELLGANCECHQLPGGHSDLLTGEAVEKISRRINQEEPFMSPT